MHEDNVKSGRYKTCSLWVAFASSFTPFLFVSSVSVVPSSPAETFVIVLGPAWLVLSGVFLVVVITNTVADMKSKNEDT